MTALARLAALAAFAALAPAAAEPPPLQTVARVDLQRYLGLWHEQARYEIAFREDLAELAEQLRILRGR